ncbi:TIR domain-containing protein [Flavobacterium sharifuzzamanii]|uniref:TIR domain-containing protein n=1 Tax=Flavobacterium sharifuzzamanii TaxID=2211133 RepID=UPI000DAF1FD6|nr:TIR domain-containing protein [Flavobacterium sharifuzzamanii]KAF2082066.1 hypothetical protein DMA14_06240 [Flavobacterium sharifuzzamanii]
MRNNFALFYSWQSDIRNNSIQGCIEKAIREVKKKYEKELNLEINIDRDTRNRTGSPAISATIFNKIDTADIFICDVTVVNKNWLNKILKHRVGPNPNVLIELGYAVNQIGWERVICVNDLRYSNPEELPFDIRGHRVTSFNSSEDKFKDNLKGQLLLAIKSIVENFEQIVKDQNEKNNKSHDLNLYHKFTKLCNEVTLLDSISLSVDSLFTSRYYFEKWDLLEEFYKISENIFIDESINESIAVFLEELDTFHSIVGQAFHLDYENSQYKEYLSLKMSDIELTEEQEFEFKHVQIYKAIKQPYRNESWQEADKRNLELQQKLFEQGEKVKSAYRDFVMIVKKKLL